jgi:hypothetical protein
LVEALASTGTMLRNDSRFHFYSVDDGHNIVGPSGIAMGLQHVYLFDGTIEDNLRLPFGRHGGADPRRLDAKYG